MSQQYLHWLGLFALVMVFPLPESRAEDVPDQFEFVEGKGVFSECEQYLRPKTKKFQSMEDRPPITDRFLQKIASLRKLRGLDIHGCEWEATGVGLQELSNLTQLTDLYVSTDSEKVIKHITTIPNLKRLGIGKARITRAAMQHLSNLTQLERLAFVGCRNITRDGMKELARLKQLRVLEIAWAAKMEDEEIKAIAQLPQLRELHISGKFQVTKDGIKELARLDNLNTFSLGLSEVSESDMADLRKALPKDCKVVQWPTNSEHQPFKWDHPDFLKDILKYDAEEFAARQKRWDDWSNWMKTWGKLVLAPVIILVYFLLRGRNSPAS